MPKHTNKSILTTELERLETFGEAVANSVTHGIGILLSIIGCRFLVTLSVMQGNNLKIISSLLYTGALIIMYTSSTLYHSLAHPPLKRYLRIMDHSAIYLLIAGTYTPFTLISLHGIWGWSLFAAVWGLAIFGISFKLVFGHRYNILSTIIYLVMGWIALVAIKPIWLTLPGGAIIWLVLGGLAYTGGIIFYLREHIPFSHTIWHLFVLLGSICHFFAVLFYVIL